MSDNEKVIRSEADQLTKEFNVLKEEVAQKQSRMSTIQQRLLILSGKLQMLQEMEADKPKENKEEKKK